MLKSALLTTLSLHLLVCRASSMSFPDYASVATGSWQVRLLPGQQSVTFSMYGSPGELEKLRELVSVMREQNLGNGFDPGPAARASSKPLFEYLATVGWPVMAYPGCADMQIQGGSCVLNRDDEAALATLEKSGAFCAVQLGEWGYYFHNLAPNENWWRDVYGKDFETYKHLMKPPGLAGYDHRPTNKFECYEIVRNYFTSRHRDLLSRTISVTGHSHYEAYAGEWGARCIGLEVGENIAFTQSKLAFARGASRQWQKPWSVQVSPWFNGACTTSGPLRQESGGARGLDAGHSLSFYQRMWLHSWFAGAALVTPENSVAIFFEQPAAPWTLTSHGRKAAEVFRFMREHDRGVPWTPMAIVLDHLAGYNGYMDKPWGILEPTTGDREIRDLFDHQLFPGSDHIHSKPDPVNPEGAYLRPTPYGESFDVLLSTASPELLSTYPVILLVGDIDFDDALVNTLARVLRSGRQVMIAARHQQALGEQCEFLQEQGNLKVLDSWINPETGRSTAISNARLEHLNRSLQPIKVSGPPVEYEINRTAKGWVIELINNQGVLKQRDKPAVIDSKAAIRVELRPNFKYALAREWKSSRTHRPVSPVIVEIPAGETEFVEFVAK
jgi:hypothetical protein